MPNLVTGSVQYTGTEAQLCYHNTFRIAGISVGFRGRREPDVAMVRPLVLFRSQREPVDIEVEVEWVGNLGPFGTQVFDSAATWRLYESDRGFQFDFSAPFFGTEPYKRLSVDVGFTRGTLEMNAGCMVGVSFPGMALSYPLDELLIMHRLTQEKAIELHGCGIVRADGIGNLFVGHSGAGKSTTTRLWTASENVEVLSDDRIIVRRDEQQQVPHFRFAEVRNDKAQKQIPRFARNDKTMRMYGTPWHGEAMYASPNSAPLARIFVLEHGHGNVLTPLSPPQAVAELFARSFVPFHRHEYVDSALEFLQELVDTVPVYRYSFEPDQRAVDTILNLHD
jgi:hypothetical protein